VAEEAETPLRRVGQQAGNYRAPAGAAPGGEYSLAAHIGILGKGYINPAQYLNIGYETYGARGGDGGGDRTWWREVVMVSRAKFGHPRNVHWQWSGGNTFQLKLPSLGQ
jgi:hypothetical protein